MANKDKIIEVDNSIVCTECGQTIPEDAIEHHEEEDCIPFYEIDGEKA